MDLQVESNFSTFPRHPDRHVGHVSWNRMRVHKQRDTKETKKGVDFSSPPPYSTEGAAKIEHQEDRRNSAIILPSSRGRADVTSDEKQRKLHRRASDDAVKKPPLHCFDPSSPSSTPQKLPMVEDSATREAAARTNVQNDVYSTMICTSPKGKERPLVSQHVLGDRSPMLLSPQKRRRYGRRNSFILRKNYPFLRSAQDQDSREQTSSAASEDDLIKSLIERVNSHQKWANSECFNEVDHTMLVEERKRVSPANPTTRLGMRRKLSPPLPLPSCKDPTTGLLLDHGWANLSWSDSDDTKWYRLMSAMSFESSKDKLVTGTTSRTSTLTAKAVMTTSSSDDHARPMLQDGTRQTSSQTSQKLSESRTSVDFPSLAPQEWKPLDYFLTSPLQNESGPVAPDGISVGLLSEESPRTPRLLVSHASSRKVASSNEIENSASSPL